MKAKMKLDGFTKCGHNHPSRRLFPAHRFFLRKTLSSFWKASFKKLEGEEHAGGSGRLDYIHAKCLRELLMN